MQPGGQSGNPCDLMKNLTPTPANTRPFATGEMDDADLLLGGVFSVRRLGGAVFLSCP